MTTSSTYHTFISWSYFVNFMQLLGPFPSHSYKVKGILDSPFLNSPITWHNHVSHITPNNPQTPPGPHVSVQTLSLPLRAYSIHFPSHHFSSRSRSTVQIILFSSKTCSTFNALTFIQFINNAFTRHSLHSLLLELPPALPLTYAALANLRRLR